MPKSMRTIKTAQYSARTLASQTGLSLSTIYRRKSKGYSDMQIVKEATIMKEHKSAGSNWKKVAERKTGKKIKDIENEWTGQTILPDGHPDPELITNSDPLAPIKERKRIVHWEPADDYGEVKRLKVLGGWLVQVATEVLFVMDPKHKWEV